MSNIVAIAGCAIMASCLLALAPQLNEQYTTARTGNALKPAVIQTVQNVPALRSIPQGPIQPLRALAEDSSQKQNGAFQVSVPGLLAGLTVSLVLLMAAAKTLLPRHKSLPAAQQYQSFAMMANSGEKIPESSALQGPTLSRRDMGPLFTGVLLSPALAAETISRPAAAADAVAPEAAVVIESPKLWIKENLPGALRGKDFVRLTADILNRQGMSPENTVACVGVCRDELCQPLVDSIESEWGDAFNMTSLGGMLTLGKTGLKAAMAHSPVDSKGRERYFFLAFPHISVDTAGVGICTRPGRPKPSKACGALYAFTSELQGGKMDTEYNPIDPEYSFMKQALLDLIPDGEKPDLLDVTKTAAEASLQQMEQLIAATVDTKKADYAVCIGVLVHEQDLRGRSAKVIGPARQYVDQVWPTAFYSVTNGRKKDLIWRLEID